MTAAPRPCLSCGTPLPAEAHFCLNCGSATPTEPGVPQRTMPTGAFEVSKVRTALADRYKILRVLGEGGMATVYLAEDLKPKREVNGKGRSSSTTLPRLVIAAVLLAGCSAPPESPPERTAGEQRQHDSILGASKIPGARGIGAAVRAADSAEARRAREAAVN
ncbi:MAG: hypothetical protein SFU57_09195 [Gemmatimonadales bacterium]|nr:hypothetical protein [Gemmatimonadales bacterium]